MAIFCNSIEASLAKMSGVVRAALRSNFVASSALKRGHGLPIFTQQLDARCINTEAEHPPQNSSAPPPPPLPFLQSDNTDLTYGRLLGINKHMLKTDVINFLEGCNLTMEDVKMEYTRSFFPTAMMLQFPTRNAFDNAFRVITRKGRLYKLERAGRSQWDIVTPYDGKTILIRGIPRTAQFVDIERALSGCEYDQSSLNIFFRSRDSPEPARMATVRFPSRTQAMNAFISKNGSFCLNSRILIEVLQ